MIPQVVVERYSSDADFDTEDFSFLFDSDHRSETSTWSFIARYSAEEVRSAEIADPDFDNPDIDRPISDDSGLIQSEGRRFRFNVSPGVEFDLTPTSQFSVVGNYTDSRFEEASDNLRDYTFGVLEFGFTHQLSERNSISTTLYGNRYDTEQDQQTSNGYGVTAELTSKISEQRTLFVNAGYEQIETEFDVDGTQTERSDGVFLFGAGLTQEYEVSRLVVDLRHSVDATGISTLVERSQARARFTRRLSPLLTAGVTARVLTEEPVSEDIERDRDFAQVRLDLSWRLNRRWSFVAEYSYTSQEFSGRAGNAAANAVRLGLRYAPPVRR